MPLPHLHIAYRLLTCLKLITHMILYIPPARPNELYWFPHGPHARE